MLKAAATSFYLTEKVGEVSHNLTGARMTAVHGPVKTTVILLEDGDTRVCLLTPNLSSLAPAMYQAIQQTVSSAIDLEPGNVLQFSSHNHTTPPLYRGRNWVTGNEADQLQEPVLTESGKKFLQGLREAAVTLPAKLEPVTVEWAVGHERRISYCRKGYYADGTSYFMREEDRTLLGADFCGDIDDQASVVRLVGEHGRTVVWLTHFSAHPVTAYHPERPCVHPEYPGVAGDLLAGDSGAEVAFLQGCCGDVNSKGLLSGDVQRAEQHGRWLGETYRQAAQTLTRSASNRLHFARVEAHLPLGPLPCRDQLLAEKAEIEAFLARARAGSEDTLNCIGLNFPRALSPQYRAVLVEIPYSWNTWALAMRDNGTADQLPETLNMPVCVLRLGDVGIAGLPCEPFTAIGRRLRAASPLPLTLPCGYCNVSYGYIPDAGNVGGREYMSSFYRYTQRPPFRVPAGNVLADAAVAALHQMQ